jgi:hypothetical protein
MLHARRRQGCPLLATFESYLAMSHQVTHSVWLDRPFNERFDQTLAAIPSMPR